MNQSDIVKALDDGHDVDLPHGIRVEALGRDAYGRGTGKIHWNGDYFMARRELGFWVNTSVRNGFVVAERALALWSLLDRNESDEIRKGAA